MGNQNHKQNCYFDMQIGNGPIKRVEFQLFDEDCPKTCENFRKLCETKFTGTNFHRCVSGFIAQGGDYINGDGSGGLSIWGKYFKDESFKNLHNKRGLLAMANKGPNTNQSQFYITFKACPELDNLHVVFGEVVVGMDTIDDIEKVSTEGGDPKQNVQIIKSGLVQKSS